MFNYDQSFTFSEIFSFNFKGILDIKIIEKSKEILLIFKENMIMGSYENDEIFLTQKLIDYEEILPKSINMIRSDFGLFIYGLTKSKSL